MSTQPQPQNWRQMAQNQAARFFHTIIALLALVGLTWFVLSVDQGVFFSGGRGAAGHIANMLIFGGAALTVVGLVLYIMRFTALQVVFLPFFDELSDLARKWRSGKPISDTEAKLAMSFAIVTGATVLGALVAVALVATPL